MEKLLISINVFSNFVVSAKAINVSFADLQSEKICILQKEAATARLN
jgi:hypothetical protein